MARYYRKQEQSLLGCLFKLILLSVTIPSILCFFGIFVIKDIPPATIEATVPATKVTVDEEIGTDGNVYKLDTTTNTYYYKDRSGKTVHVNGYYRKDGTYVQPHDRSAPGNKEHPAVPAHGGKRK